MISRFKIISLVMIVSYAFIVTPSMTPLNGSNIDNIYKVLNLPVSAGNLHPGDNVSFGKDERNKITVIQLLRILRENPFFSDYSKKYLENKETIVETGDTRGVLKIPYKDQSNVVLNSLVNNLMGYLINENKSQNVSDQFKESFKRLIINFFQ